MRVGAGDACAAGHPSGHQCRPSRRAEWIDVEITEPDTGGREFIHVRSFDHGVAMTGHIGIALVIGHH